MGPKAVEAALAFRYRGEDRSFLYRLVLSPLADACVAITPRWIAPNVLTVAALALTAVSFAVAVMLFNPALSPDASAAAPGWVAALAAACLLGYQTLDNMDGKQARRIGLASPLGLLVDHGCDAVHAGVLGPLTAAAVLGAPAGSWQSAAILFAGTAPFFTNSWESLHTGSFVLPFFNGPSDGLATIAAAYAARAALGPDALAAALPAAIADPAAAAAAAALGPAAAAAVLRATVLDFACAGTAALAAATVVAQVGTTLAFEASFGLRPAPPAPDADDHHSRIHLTADGDRPRAPRGGPVAAGLRVAAAAARLAPAIALATAVAATYVAAPALLRRGPVLIMGLFGFAFADITVRVMVAHVSAAEPSLPQGLADAAFAALPAALEWTMHHTRTGRRWLSPGIVMAACLLALVVQCAKVVQLGAEVSGALVEATGVPMWTVPRRGEKDKDA